MREQPVNRLRQKHAIPWQRLRLISGVRPFSIVVIEKLQSGL